MDILLSISENESENNAALHLSFLDEYFKLQAISPRLRPAFATPLLKKPLSDPELLEVSV
jgi:hypothetical protein